jgi:hypothetical protein
MYAALPGSTARLMPTRRARIASSASVSVSKLIRSACCRRSTQACSCSAVSTVSYSPGADSAGSSVPAAGASTLPRAKPAAVPRRLGVASLAATGAGTGAPSSFSAWVKP